MSTMGASLESGNPLGDRGPLPVCHEGEINRVSRDIQPDEDLGVTMRFSYRTSFTSPSRSSDRDAADQSP